VTIPINTLKTLHGHAEASTDEDCPLENDRRWEANPYKSRCGDDWEAKIRQSSFLSKYVCVIELVDHICIETEKLFKGSMHEDDRLFYHDALSLMTARVSVEYMKEEDYFKRWILPVLGLNEDLPCYSKRPVGNLPELMSWDFSLHKDVHECVNRHIAISKELPEDDPLSLGKGQRRQSSRPHAVCSSWRLTSSRLEDRSTLRSVS
jgi:hypothetical protein